MPDTMRRITPAPTKPAKITNAVTGDMLNVDLTDLYSFESVTMAVKQRRYLQAFEAGRGLTVKAINAFLDNDLTVIELFEDVASSTAERGLEVVRYQLSEFRASYDFLWNNEHIMTLQSHIMGSDNENFYVQNFSEASGMSVEDARMYTGLLEVAFEIYGSDWELIEQAYKLITDRVRNETFTKKRSVVRWRYSSGHSTESMLMSIEKDWEIVPEAYPWITTPLADYYKAYTQSKSSILVCYGPPGTGKTSFIRDYLCEERMNAIVSYDAGVLASDEMFTFFLGSPAYNVLVVEDADEVLTSDRESKNKLVAKLLNSSDGLLKLPQKKIILSTNLENVSHIDEAILRPGRCFDFINFRKLKPAEQGPLVKALGIDYNIAGDASLAEIYKTSEPGYTQPHAQKMGFV